MNRLNELADRLEQAMGGVTVKEIVALLRAAAAEDVGSSLDDGALGVPETDREEVAMGRYGELKHVARLAVVAARKERDEAESTKLNLVAENVDLHNQRAALQRAIDEAVRISDDNTSMYLRAKDERDEALAKLRDREAELLRVRTHENAAAHELDCKLSPEERHTFKRLADRNAVLQWAIEEAYSICNDKAGRNDRFRELCDLLWKYSIKSPHATQREGTKAEPPKSTVLHSPRFAEEAEGIAQCLRDIGIDAVTKEAKPVVACKQCGSECGDQKYRAPELRNLCDNCICGDTPAPADDTRELVARLAEAESNLRTIARICRTLVDGRIETEAEHARAIGACNAIIRDARRGGAE